MTPRTNHAPAIKAALADPKRTLEALGLFGAGRAHQRQAAGFLIRCPVHDDRTPSCSVQVRDGVLLWKCHSCDASGDVLSLVAAVRGLSLRTDFRGVLVESARLAGLWGVVRELETGEAGDAAPPISIPAPTLPQAAPESPRTYPGTPESFWGHLRPVATVELVADYLRGRAIDPDVVDDRDLARVIPERGELPVWARYQGRSWRETGHRLIVPMFDADGELRSVRAWRIVDGESPKRLPPAGHKASGLVMADQWALAWLRGQRAPKRIVVAEGEPDFCVWATRLNDPSLALVGIVSGSWGDAFAARVPIGCRVDVRTDADEAGARYMTEIAASLKRRTPCVYRIGSEGI